jgi:ribonuclease HII
MRLAVQELLPKADYILVDGKPVPDLPLPSQNIIKGDSKSASIAAASIVAKVYRDRLMVEADQKYPGYDFAKNMGYGTKAHREALNKLGPCPIHRKSFKPIADLLNKKNHPHQPDLIP